MKNPLLLMVFMVFFSSTLFANPPSNSTDWTATFKQGLNISHWMAQHFEGKYADSYRFSEKDAKWIAKHGFDHVRIPIDGRILMSVEGKLIHELLEPFDEALIWAEKYRLGVILDMHYMPGAEFLTPADENKLWVNKSLQATVTKMWIEIAKKYKNVGPNLRYEVLNEAIAPESSMVNDLNRMIVGAIREIDATRVIYVSSNKHGSFAHAKDVYVFKNDPNIHYTFHFYDPQIFTHQHAPWAFHIGYYNEDVLFPFQINDLDKYFPEGHIERSYNNQLIDEAFIDKKYDELGAWGRKNGVDILVSEFGVYNPSDDASTERYIRAIRKACERNNLGWTIWDYKGDFAVRLNGKPTVVWKGLFK